MKSGIQVLPREKIIVSWFDWQRLQSSTWNLELLTSFIVFSYSGGVDNLLFSVSGLLFFSASWYRALLFPYLLTHLVTMHVFKIWLRRTLSGFLLIVRLSWLLFRSRELEVILNTLGCRLSCKNKSIKRKSCFEEQTLFCGLLLVSILNSCREYRLNEVSCAYLHFLSVLPRTFVKYKSSRFFYRQTRSFSSPSSLFLN